MSLRESYRSITKWLGKEDLTGRIKKAGRHEPCGTVDRQVLWPVGGKMEPLGETREPQRATAQAFS